MHQSPIFSTDSEVQKSKESDLAFLKTLLNSHSFESPPAKKYFHKQENIMAILHYMKDGYFSHYDLYNFVFSNK